MKKLILAIESSCDETAMCIIDTNKNILAHVVNSQADDFKQLGGVVPELASRKHVDNIFYVYEAVLKQANITINDIDYIAVTSGPGLIGSLLVGVNFANSLSTLYGIPLIPINHMQGHIYAITKNQEVEFPHLSLIISGGHTDLVYLKKPLDFELVGQTLDDACGESFDKIAKLLDLGYPGGPRVEQLALTGTNNIKLPQPKKDDSLNFSFSGLKSACFNYVNQQRMKNEEINVNDFCASFQQTVIDTLVYKLDLAQKTYKPKQISVVGGVSNNKAIKVAINDNFENVIFPKPELTTDNAAMIGLLAVEKVNHKCPTTRIINADPGINVEYNWE